MANVDMLKQNIVRGCFCFVAAVCMLTVTESECEGQLFRRNRFRVYGNNHPVQLNRNLAQVDRIPPGPANWSDVLGYDPRIHLDADRFSRFPKYIGGFHSSHFSNIGVPTGDIGFRGNGIYWAPW